MKQNISCYMVQQTVPLLSLQQLLEMSTFCPYTYSKMLMPPISCIVSDAVVHAVSSIQRTVLQFINAV